MKITILVEGRTEQAFKTPLLEFMKPSLEGRMPSLDFFTCDGRVYKGDKLRRVVEGLLNNGKRPADAVIAVTDAYTGTGDFDDAEDAKRKMGEWVGANDKFYPHAAQHDFEAWLLPFWKDLRSLRGDKMSIAISESVTGEPKLTLEQKPACFDPELHWGEVIATGLLGKEILINAS